MTLGPREPTNPGLRHFAVLRAVVAVAGLVIAVLGAVTVAAVENRRASVEVAQSLERRLAALAAGINEISVTAGGLAAHIAAERAFDRPSVERFVAEMPVANAVETLFFAERFTAEERDRYEAALAARGVLDGIRDVSASEGLTPADDRPVHVVVTYVQYPDDALFTEGVDLMSDRSSREAILFAAREDEITASAAQPLQAAGDAARFQVFAPVFANGAAETGDIFGVAVAQVNLDLLLARTFTTTTQIATIADLSDDAGLIYSRDVDLPRVADTVERSFSAANRTWQVSFATVAGRNTLLAPLAVFLGCTLLTLLAIALLEWSQLRRRARQTNADFAEALERLGVSEESYNALFGNLAVGVSQVEVDSGRFVAINDRFCEMLGYTRDELRTMTSAEVEDRGPTDPGPLELAESTEAAQPPGRDGVVSEKRYRRKDGSIFWGLASVSETAAGHAPMVTTVVQDITPAKDAEASLRILVRELAHRVRNTTQLISSLADQTRQQATDARDYHARFVGRLHALSSAQDALFERSWSHVDAGDVIRRALHPFTARDGGRLSADIDRVDVSAQEAQTLALTMHELGANAVRHGAWSVSRGEVELTVRRLPPESDDAACALDIVWVERGGPVVSEPSHRGFGSTMLTRLLPAQHTGRSEVFYDPEGFRFHAHLKVRRRDDDDEKDERSALRQLSDAQ